MNLNYTFELIKSKVEAYSYTAQEHRLQEALELYREYKNNGGKKNIELLDSFINDEPVKDLEDANETVERLKSQGLIKVQPSERYLTRLKLIISDSYTLEELQELRPKVIKDPGKYAAFLLVAIDSIIKDN